MTMNEMDKLKELFKRFPGIGPKQAERFVYFLLHNSKQYRNELANTINVLDKHSKKCSSCERYFVVDSPDETVCKICGDDSRTKDKLLIIEKETDIDKIESSNVYDGMYFVSMGTLSPLGESKKHEFFLDRILNKIKQMENLKEVILVFSTTFEGEYTAKFVKEELQDYLESNNIKLSLPARGLASGFEIEYTDVQTLRYALKNRN